MTTPEQIKAARALLRMEQEELAKRAGVSITTIRRLEAANGEHTVADETAQGVQLALQEAGVEFIHDGVLLKRGKEETDALFRNLLAIAEESARLLKDTPQFTEDDLYDEQGLPGLIAIDSSALIAILSLEPEAQKFLGIIAHARAGLISAVSFLESSIVLAARKKEAGIWQPFDGFLSQAGIEVVAFDEDQARLARTAFLKYGKGRHPAALNFGDCATYALAKSRNVPLLFKGDDFRKTDIIPAL